MPWCLHTSVYTLFYHGVCDDSTHTRLACALFDGAWQFTVLANTRATLVALARPPIESWPLSVHRGPLVPLRSHTPVCKHPNRSSRGVRWWAFSLRPEQSSRVYTSIRPLRGLLVLRTSRPGATTFSHTILASSRRRTQAGCCCEHPPPGLCVVYTQVCIDQTGKGGHSVLTRLHTGAGTPECSALPERASLYP